MILGIILILLGLLALVPWSRVVASYFTTIPQSVFDALEWLTVIAACIGVGFYFITAHSLF